MTALNEQTVRTRVEADWTRIVDLLKEKIALKAVSAQGITGEHMKRSAQFVAAEMRKVGIDAHVEQSTNPDGTPGAWEVIGSHIVDPDAPTVLLYAHHDVQPAPNPADWGIDDPFTATQVGDRLYGRGTCDDGGGIAIHSGALHALGDDLHVNIKVFFEGEEEMGSRSFIPFIEAHRDEFDSDVIIVADSGNWTPDIPSLTTSLRGNTTLDVSVKVLDHPVHSGQYGGPILDANTLAAMCEAFGVEPINKGEGGSIPFIPELQRIFPKAQVLVTGPEDPQSNAHSPNESVSLPGLKKNVVAEALLLAKLGQ